MQNTSPKTRRQLALDLVGKHSPSLENFVSGDNQDAVHALRALAAEAAQILLWGPSGCGKTHLEIAACRDFTQRSQSCAYLPLDEFSPDESDVLADLDSVDLVCIDKLDTKLGLETWEIALYHLISSRKAAGLSLLLALRPHPKQIEIGLKDLGSRLLWGPAFCLAPLEDIAKSSLLIEAAQHRGLELPEDVISFLFRNYPRDLGYLMALLERLDRASLEDQRRITIPFVKSVLSSV